MRNDSECLDRLFTILFAWPTVQKLFENFKQIMSVFDSPHRYFKFLIYGMLLKPSRKLFRIGKNYVLFFIILEASERFLKLLDEIKCMRYSRKVQSL